MIDDLLKEKTYRVQTGTLTVIPNQRHQLLHRIRSCSLLHQVRAAANSVVVAMTSRKELQLALMPHKEGLVAIARSGTEDPEPRVAMEGSKAAQNLAWWP